MRRVHYETSEIGTRTVLCFPVALAELSSSFVTATQLR